jgi:UDP-glucose 4-epimerase
MTGQDLAMRDMKIVVLGGSGFIGRKLVSRFRSEGCRDITVFDRTSAADHDDDGVRHVSGSFAAGFDFAGLVRGADLVVHLISTSVPGTESGALSEIQRNVIPSVELFQACAECGVKKVVFLSSGGTVYGNSGRQANRETDLPDPINTYGLQKLMIEQALRLCATTGGFDCQIIRLSNPYGPGQNPQGPLGLITKLVYQAINGETIQIFGDGSVVRDFIYIDDAVACIMDVIGNGAPNETVNIGRGVGTSVSEVIETLERVLPIQVNVTHRPGRSVDVPYSVLDIAKYRSFGSVREFVSLADGIRKTYDFFRKG